MIQVSSSRLLALRALYLLMAVGLGLVIWPSILWHEIVEPQSPTVVRSLLGALAVIALLGVRYPLQMLPILIFELLWKVIWAVAFAFPAWQGGQLGAYGEATFYECLPAFVLFPLIIPWRYFIHRYFKAPGESWCQPGTNSAA